LVATVEPRAASFAVRFISDDEMRALNSTWRGLDKTTDVLSFPGDLERQVGLGFVPEPSSTLSLEGDHLGDVAIAVPTARRQAQELGHGLETELKILLLHGVLHCLGYDHERDDGTMARVETLWRRHFGLEGDFDDA
jgi:probable rRNA maturation factor